MLNRAKKIAAELTRQLARPMIVATVPHEVRGLMADLSAELIELNQRLDAFERSAANVRADVAADRVELVHRIEALEALRLGEKRDSGFVISYKDETL